VPVCTSLYVANGRSDCQFSLVAYVERQVGVETRIRDCRRVQIVTSVKYRRRTAARLTLVSAWGRRFDEGNSNDGILRCI
jgi:hypothetical protein